jgi:two-component system, NtrC family, sensor histidine kinase HydH
VLTREAVPLAQLIEDAFKEAHKHQPAKSAKLLPEESSQPVILSGDRSALRHAISEVILNAIQANPAEAKVRVRTFTDTDGHGQPWVHLEITDNGTGFTPEAVQKIATPFFTTRTVGLGLGLCVVRRIIETHQGRLAVVAPTPGQPGTVRISLPQQSSAAAA